MKKGKDMVDKEHVVHMDQELNLEEEGTVDEDWEGTYMGLDTGKEKMIHNYPFNSIQNYHPSDNIIAENQNLILNTKGS